MLHCPAVVLSGPEEPVALKKNILAMGPPSGVIITSPAGLAEAHRLLGASWLARQPLVVPGESTARKAVDLGVPTVISPPGSGDSEAMLALPVFESVAGQSWMILAAAGGRRLIEFSLRHRGARVTRFHIYQRRMASFSLTQQEHLARASAVITLLASAAAVDWLKSVLPDDGWRKIARGVVIAPSARVAALAREAGCDRVELASGADDQAMLAALARCTKQSVIITPEPY